MIQALKRIGLAVWTVEQAIRMHIRLARALYFRGGRLGRLLCALMDRWMLITYGDMHFLD